MADLLVAIDDALADWKRTSEALTIAAFMRDQELPPLTPWQFEVLRQTGQRP